MSSQAQITQTVKCPNCGQIGTAVWAIRPELVSLSNGFYERLSRVPITSQPQIMCGDCNAPVHPIDPPPLGLASDIPPELLR